MRLNHLIIIKPLNGLADENSRFNKDCVKEQKLMEKHGFDVRKLSYKNALD